METSFHKDRLFVLPRWAGWWLLLLFVLVLFMMQIGAITRLTESGLSMVEWRPIMGSLPPLSEAEWNRVFALYKGTAEYRSFPIELSAFKSIFWWEYIHRAWGRLIGLVAVLPFLWLLLRGSLNAWWKKHLTLVIALGALQGVIGYWMVVSGLSARLDVAPERLATHLFIAIGILIYLGFLIHRAWFPSMDLGVPLTLGVKLWVWLSTIWVCVLAFSGVLVAGLNAGFVYNSFPLMGDSFFPLEYAYNTSGWWSLFFDDQISAQFHHRMLAYGSLIVVGMQAYFLHSCAVKRLALISKIQFFLLVLQAMIGIATLLSVVWLPFALMHQLGAVALLLVSFFVWLDAHSFKNIARKVERTTNHDHARLLLRN